MENQEFRSGFVSIVGSPNVGKSTLINALVGQKIAIVSNKPQTTRSRIRGIVNLPNAQMILIDTPGIQEPRNRLGETMLKTSYGSMKDGDASLFLVDPTNGLRQRDEGILRRLQQSDLPCIAAINKIDVATPTQLEAVRERLAAEDWLNGIVEISAMTGKNLPELMEKLAAFLQPGPAYFPQDMVTDQPERVLCEEFIRESCLINLSDEIPHGMAVEIEKIAPREDKDLVDVWANIYCEREAHKQIIIGKNGAMLRKIGSMARMQIEWLFESKVNLQLWVKVKKNWRDNAREIKALGFDQE